MRILFVCTHNRCRSILSEALAQYGQYPEIEAASAGSDPAGEVHPDTLQHLAEAGVSTVGLRSKSLQDIKDFNPHMVVTVCDGAAKTPCPLWLGEAMVVHWSLPDPSKIESESKRRVAFIDCINTIEARLRGLSDAIAANQQDQDALAVGLERLGATVENYSSLNS